MLSSSTRRLCLLTLVGAALAAASLAPAASAATQRYASPSGAGDCSAASPCSIEVAVSGAKAGDEVIVNPGDYPLTATLSDPAQITMHGVAGQPRPRLRFSGAGQLGLQLLHGSTLRYVEVEQTVGSNGALVNWDGTVDQVIARAPGSTATIQRGTILNSVVVASAANDGPALRTGAHGNTISSTYRNVTAIATATGAIAIDVFCFGAAGNATVDAANVIARGGPPFYYSLRARTDSSGCHSTITHTHSNYGTVATAGSNAVITSKGGDLGYAPVFVNAAGGDYRQAAGSPTIGAGLDDPAANGAFDVDRDPRRIGATDIGADEFVVAPAATTGPAGSGTDQSAALSGGVDPKGAPTSYHFEYGPTTAYGATSATIDAGSGTGTVPAAATLGGLSPATTYHYRIVAANAGGITKGADWSFTTAAPTTPPPSTPPPTMPPPTTRPPARPFAGIGLVSTRLSFARRFITLRLRCPAATVARCSGRTTLSARPRRTSSRAAPRVTLGRARFSIAAGKQARVRLRVSRAGRRLLGRTRRLRGRATSAARDGAGQSKTTLAAVTIRRRHA